MFRNRICVEEGKQSAFAIERCGHYRERLGRIDESCSSLVLQVASLSNSRVDVGTYISSNYGNSTARILELQALDSRALTWYAVLHPSLRYSTDTFSLHSQFDSAP